MVDGRWCYYSHHSGERDDVPCVGPGVSVLLEKGQEGGNNNDVPMEEVIVNIDLNVENNGQGDPE